MDIVVNLLKVSLFSLLLLLMFTVKGLRNCLVWVMSLIDKLMLFGKNGLNSEIEKLKISIKKLIKEIYQKITS